MSALAEASGVYLDGEMLEYRGEREKVKGLAREAIAHLIATVNAVPMEYSLGDYHLEVFQLFHGDNAVTLTKSEVKVMRVLMGHPGNPVPAERLFRVLYGDKDDMPTLRVIPVFISNMRKKLREAEMDMHIESKIGMGYYLQ